MINFSIHSLNSHLFSVSVNWKQISKRIDIGIGIGRYLSSSIDIGIGRGKVVSWHPYYLLMWERTQYNNIISRSPWTAGQPEHRHIWAKVARISWGKPPPHLPQRSLGHHGGSSSRCSDAEQVWGVLVWRRVEVYANRPQTCREPAAGHGSPASVGCSGLEEGWDVCKSSSDDQGPDVERPSVVRNSGSSPLLPASWPSRLNAREETKCGI